MLFVCPSITFNFLSGGWRGGVGEGGEGGADLLIDISSFISFEIIVCILVTLKIE